MSRPGACVLAFVTAATLGNSGIEGSSEPLQSGVQAFILDGTLVGSLRSVTGGTMVADVVVESKGPGNVNKRPSPPRVDPLVLEVDLGGMDATFLNWVASALAGKPESRTASVVTYDFSMKEVSRRTFKNIRVAEVTLPALDGASKEAAFITVTAQADSSFLEKSTSSPTSKPKATRSNAANFKLSMPGLETSRVAKISPITVKVSGRGAEVSNFVVTVSGIDADSWVQWHDLFIVQGKGTDQNEKTADIDLLDPTMKDTLFRIHVEGVGILRALPSAEAGTKGSTIRRLEVELYAERLRVENK
jgi:hypothetical protein